KVCGITSQEDASAAIEGGATAIGFNFYSRSPRYIAPERAAAIMTAEGVRRVGVFVNEQREHVEEVARLASLDTAQLHGEETAANSPASLAVWKAFRVGADFDLDHAGEDALAAEALLLDGPAGELYGGAGRTFDWSLATVAARRIILAGGLDASNVAKAVAL